MTVNMNLAEVVRFHRKKAKISRNDLALLAGIGKTSIYDIEHGKNTMQWDTALAILNALNIHVGFESPLLDGNSGLDKPDTLSKSLKI